MYIASIIVFLQLVHYAVSFPASPPPNVPSATVAAKELLGLRVAPQGSSSGYDRDMFPHWITQNGNCNTREVVLKRDGINVRQGDGCQAVSGEWKSPFDGKTWTEASDLDIDHVVPLSNAWKSGASAWTKEKRQAFANDLQDPELIAVTDDVNQAKGDKSPDEWKPPLATYHCTYARMWIRVKSKYALSITKAEKTALESMLGTCS